MACYNCYVDSAAPNLRCPFNAIELVSSSEKPSEL